jgi:hypothetical protein
MLCVAVRDGIKWASMRQSLPTVETGDLTSVNGKGLAHEPHCTRKFHSLTSMPRATGSTPDPFVRCRHFCCGIGP